MDDRWPRTIHKDLSSRVFVKNPRTHLLSTAPVLSGSYMIMNPRYNRDATVPHLHRASTQDQYGRCTKSCHTRAAMRSAYAPVSFFLLLDMYIGPNEALMHLFCSATRRGRALDHTRLLRPTAVAHSPPPQARLHSQRSSLSSLSVFIYSAKSQGLLEQTDSQRPATVPRQYARSRTSTPRPAPTKWVLPGTPG